MCKARGMRQEVDSRDEVMHSEMSDSGLNRQAVQIKKEKKITTKY